MGNICLIEVLLKFNKKSLAYIYARIWVVPSAGRKTPATENRISGQAPENPEPKGTTTAPGILHRPHSKGHVTTSQVRVRNLPGLRYAGTCQDIKGNIAHVYRLDGAEKVYRCRKCNRPAEPGRRLCRYHIRDTAFFFRSFFFSGCSGRNIGVPVRLCLFL